MACKTKFAVKLVTFIRDCGEVIAVIEVYAYRTLVAGYGIWHLIQELK